ncbi:hypothetical protein CV685_00850 [Borreliella burgdorferi]|uniref:hypothetical protein n=1 Tax=Borreliella burgdorferi TaxID=139 RepID=UPI00016C5837|nr:hypothetical protein [Borreliella burgdorferi]AXK70170.1 hypothetical protein BbuMM1_01700 [Borreliella burgdorferi]EEH00257.1 conserved hypothetical protein [Borreliella burgdorferi 94a]PRR06181.1 hypothetical protein CV664_00850 [Borreliella burgdorferi]PRR42102.1 hypothetical protein CV685_00850 [Borreliella burgdorferi]PRR61028.1 hypothetical protein CV639_00850 [Borreliella burgdorferi]
MKRAVSNLFLFLTLSLYSYEIKNEIFMPTRYYVGDSVDFKVLLILNNGEEFFPVDFKDINIKDEFVEVNSISFNNTTNEIIVNFVSFYIGSSSLPSIYIGDVISNGKKNKVILKNIKINTDKLVSNNSDFKIKNIEGVLFIPGTSTYLFLFIFVLFLIPYLVIKLLKLLNRLLIYLIVKHGLKKPYKVLQRQFVILSKYVRDGGDQSAFYNLINSSLRVYLSKKTGFDFNAITTTEISIILQDLKVPYEIRSIFINTLRLSDFSKFSGVDLVFDSLSFVLEDLRTAASNFEEFNRGANVNI